MKNCLECDNALKGKQKKFCGDLCRKKNWKKNSGREVTNKWQRTWFRKRARANWQEKNCFVCSLKFLPDLGHKIWQIYCSKKCSAFIVRKVSRQNNRVQKLYQLKGKITCEQWKNKILESHWRCQVCKKNFNYDRRKLEMDHIIPLSKGGQHVIENVRVSCRKCNRKNDTSFKSSIAFQTSS